MTPISAAPAVERAVELAIVVRLDQRVEVKLGGESDQTLQGILASARTISNAPAAPAPRASTQLQFVDDEVLPEHRKPASRGHGGEVSDRAAEEGAVGQHRDRRSPAQRHTRSPSVHRVERLVDRPGRRRPPLDLGDHGHRRPAARRRNEPRRRAALRGALQRLAAEPERRQPAPGSARGSRPDRSGILLLRLPFGYRTSGSVRQLPELAVPLTRKQHEILDYRLGHDRRNRATRPVSRRSPSTSATSRSPRCTST